MNRRNKYTFAALSLPYSLICSSLFNLYFAQLIIAKNLQSILQNVIVNFILSFVTNFAYKK
ncbi:hypothetical protein GCM10008911_14740 [Ligilactobacillus aviarius]|uniref:Uncharacterized protein n=1 Tax=Ligilactobacillus aviarius TaxID=1606 RepID=A0A510WV30_9LACO|nr:hypothetical protein LAV01_07170 [Ligilactobacillus aviarius]